MTTKAKTTGTPDSAASLEDLLAGALRLVDSGDYEGAAAGLESLLLRASEAGHIGMERAAKSYLCAVRSRMEKAEACPADPLAQAQFHLNRRESDAALQVIASMPEGTSAEPKRLYLKALAFAQKEDAEGAGAALQAALGLDEGLVHPFQMEPDFDAVRSAVAPLLGQG